MMTITVADIENANEKRGFFPAFPSRLESYYRSTSINEQYKFSCLSYIVGLCLVDLFIFSDFFVTGDDFKYYVVGRFFLCTPFCLLSIYGLSRKDRFYEVFDGLIPLTLAANNAILITISKGQYRLDYLISGLLFMIVGCAIGRPRLSYAIPTVIAQYCLYETVVLTTDIVAPANKIVDSTSGLCCVVISLAMAYAADHINRRAFLLGIRVRLLNEELKAMTLTDPLTGLGNRRAYEKATQRFWDASARHSALASFILIDLDRFKSFNDSYGHSAGDLCLTTVGRCIASQMRTDRDVAVRFGGEEFVVFLPDTAFNEAWQVAEQVRTAILRAAIPHPVLAPDAVVSASLGVTTAVTSEFTPAELVIRADMALYAAKHNGRNQVWPPLGSTQDGFSQPATTAAVQDHARTG